MPSKKKTSSKSVKVKGEPIFTWAMESSRPRAGGQKILYEVRLNDDGSVSCNCPGWVFKKKSEVRGCKHTKLAENHPSDPAKEVFKKWKRGESLPLLEVGIGTTQSLSLSTVSGGGHGGSKFGRKLMID